MNILAEKGLQMKKMIKNKNWDNQDQTSTLNVEILCITPRKVKDMRTNHLLNKTMQGKIIWDNTKPDGQPRRCLDIENAKNKIDFEAKTPLREGIRKTIEWHKSNKL